MTLSSTRKPRQLRDGDSDTLATDGGEGDGVLPFEADETDVHEGIGVVVTIIDLAEAPDDADLFEGRCRFCGYDRGRRTSHTEVEGSTIRCDHCGLLLHRDQ